MNSFAANQGGKGINFDQLRRDNLNKNPNNFDQLQWENLQKDQNNFDELRHSF